MPRLSRPAAVAVFASAVVFPGLLVLGCVMPGGPDPKTAPPPTPSTEPRSPTRTRKAPPPPEPEEEEEDPPPPPKTPPPAPPAKEDPPVPPKDTQPAGAQQPPPPKKPSPEEVKSGIAITDAEIDLSKSFRSETRVISLTFDATIKKKKPDHTYFHGKGRCKVGDKVLVDEGSSLDSLKEVEENESKRIKLYYFNGSGRGLPDTPTWCSITVVVGNALKGKEKVTEFCWVSGSLTQAPCSKDVMK